VNEEDEIISVRRLRSTHTSLESRVLSNGCSRLPPKARPPNHSMGDDSSRFGLRLVGELPETITSHPARNKIRRGIVWQAAYSLQLTHSDGLAGLPQSSNHSEDVILSSSATTPYAH